MDVKSTERGGSRGSKKGWKSTRGAIYTGGGDCPENFFGTGQRSYYPRSILPSGALQKGVDDSVLIFGRVSAF